MWLIANYEAAPLFSLKPCYATASGGKTLLIPTPHTVKLAILTAECQTLGVDQAQGRWAAIRDLNVAVRPPEHVVVSNTFQRVLKPYKNPPKLGVPDFGPFQRTIGYREYAQWVGALSLAIGWDDNEERAWLIDLLLQINYFGKRGGLVQLMEVPQHTPDLPERYVALHQEASSFRLESVLQVLDDCTPSMTFNKINIYTDEKIADKDRAVRHIALPYRLKRSSKSYAWYERSE